MMKAAAQLAEQTGVAPACKSLGVPRASFYRASKGSASTERAPASRPTPARALTVAEKQEVLAVLHSERFADKAPATVCAELLDESTYLCSPRTMYRILHANSEVRERRNQLRHPQYKKPQLVADTPNRIWSWDITKLLGPVKWTYFYLYVIIDIFSRYVVGWTIATRETAAISKDLIEATVQKYGVLCGQLTVHSDRGSQMISKTVALLLGDLGVTKSHSRPHVSNDNPFSESQFKTLKYRPDFPERFGSIQDARSFCRDFFQWYNLEHRHSGICFLTPHDVHFGNVEAVVEVRQAALNAAFVFHPERFVKGPPVHPALPPAVWINPPSNIDSP